MNLTNIIVILTIVSLIYSLYTLFYDKDAYNVISEIITRIFEPITNYLIDLIFII